MVLPPVLMLLTIYLFLLATRSAALMVPKSTNVRPSVTTPTPITCFDTRPNRPYTDLLDCADLMRKINGLPHPKFKHTFSTEAIIRQQELQLPYIMVCAYPIIQKWSALLI